MPASGCQGVRGTHVIYRFAGAGGVSQAKPCQPRRLLWRVPGFKPFALELLQMESEFIREVDIVAEEIADPAPDVTQAPLRG